ncbi:S41 family peptidase [Lysinibacillus sp. FSL K6-3209]|uniref:S41 family peptidase n=1 Tax=Lysinibacillus sp. FSL K6-3209 TaxID=2921497 RepID=UPI0030DD155C
MSKVITIEEETLEKIFEKFGIIIQKSDSKISIIDIYPPLPKEIQSNTIVKANGKASDVSSNWAIGENIVEFDNGSQWILTLEDFDWSQIVYENFTSNNHLFLQCISFDVIPKLDEQIFKKNIVVDLRVNFGGELQKMINYYNWFVDTCKKYSIAHIYILVSNSTCSSAELFADKFKDDKNTTIIGSKTYGKEYIYKQITAPNKKVLIPISKIETDFNIDIPFDFNYYYAIKSMANTRSYKPPEIMML